MNLSENKTFGAKGGRTETRRATYSKDNGAFPVTMAASGTVEGYAATFDHDQPDSYGDVIARGAFSRTLREWAAKARDGVRIPLLYAHNTDDPRHNIGHVVEAREDSRGLYVKAEFDANNELAQYARQLAVQGRLHTFSFAYSVRDQRSVTLSDGTKANELRDLDLFEISLVVIPANQRAVVTDVKGRAVDNRRRLEALKQEASRLLGLA